MNILFLAAQAPAPANAGGLPETACLLPAALAALGHAVRVAVPARAVSDRRRLAPTAAARLTVPHVAGDQVARVSQVQRDGVTYYLIAGSSNPSPRHSSGDAPW